MADNKVVVEFIADTGSFTSGIGKVESELAALKGAGGTDAMAAWRKEAGLAEQATIGASGGLHRVAGAAYRTAADFRPATQAMRDASVALEDTGRRAQSATPGFRALRLDLLVLVGAFVALKAAADAAINQQVAKARFVGQTGGGTGGLASSISADALKEAFMPSEALDVARGMSTAGVATNRLRSDLIELEKAARISGVSLEALGKIEDNVWAGQSSLEDMKNISLATQGATQGLTDKYRMLDEGVRIYNQDLRVATESQQRQVQVTQQQTAGVNSFAEKVGLSGDVFAKWKEQGMSGSVASGDYRLQGDANKLTGQYSEGVKQIAKDNEISTQTVKDYINTGKIGYQDLIAASAKYRSEKQQEVELTRKQAAEAKAVTDEEAKRNLERQALGVLLGPSSARDKAAAAQVLSPEGVMQAKLVQAQMAAVTVGNVLADHIQALTIAIGVLTAAMAVDRAIAVASRSMDVAKKLFPNVIPVGERLPVPGEPATPKLGPGDLNLGVASFVASGLLMGPIIQRIDDLTGGKHPALDVWSGKSHMPTSMGEVMGAGKVFEKMHDELAKQTEILSKTFSN